MVFAAIDGQALAAVTAYLVTSHCTASVLSRPPRNVGKSGSAGEPLRSLIHSRQQRHGVGRQWRCSFLAPLAGATHMGAGGKHEVSAGESSEFGDPEPG